MFNTFYSVTYSSGFYSFQARTGVVPVCSVPIKGIHDWKQKFFYIRRGVIPSEMTYRQVAQGIPRVDSLEDFAAQEWYGRITAKATAISQLDEMALVGAGMSMLWVPKHPLGQPVYSHRGKCMIPSYVVVGYSLLNALDPKAAGAMVEAIQADGNPTWLDQIRDRFLHPTEQSLSRYAAEVLGEDVWDDFVNSDQEDVIVVSSGSSGRGGEDLTSRSARAGTVPGGDAEPVHEVVGDDDDAEASIDPSAQLETRKKARTDRSGRRGEGAEGGAAGSSRKRPSILSYLDYVVVSDTLSGLGPGEVRQESDPDDRATLTEHMKKKSLDDHKRRLDEQAAALLAAKRAKLQKEAPPAPSESEVDLGVFSGGRGNLLEEIYAASAPRPVLKTGKKPRPVDISQITPPTSPPSRTAGLTPSRDDVEVNVEGGETGGGGGAEGGGDVGGNETAGNVAAGDKGKGIELDVESSETTPPQTIYTKRPPGDGAASGTVRSSHFERVPEDSWDNPACDDMPHAPRWNLVQGSRMDDLDNCHQFFSLSLPPAERMFQKTRNRFALMDDHVRAGVNFFATSQEILREWRSMGEEILEFEESKKAFSEEREKFNAEKKGLQWRVAEAERKLEEQKKLSEQKQKDWESACARTNLEMQSQRDAIVRLSGEKTALADEANQVRLAAEKKEKEYIARIDKLELLAQEKRLNVRLLSVFLMRRRRSVVPLNSLLRKPQLILGGCYLVVFPCLLIVSYIRRNLPTICLSWAWQVITADASLGMLRRRAFAMLDFAVVKAAGKLALKADGVALLKKALGDDGAGGAGSAGPSRP
ncbi:hypothetical protein HanXRQr2_Chr09g0371221 [Helianthus annuus]|uniref:Transposase (Putative), gypsy type n=1 Tax=Helianthus annuus TaxID=4232 RepID=A0A9K3I3K0_HELAN|nr:hypothetical protein HanXRQr2_Chr09g0371221 [Helianthus annuus]